ncbi:DUF4288 domain-containing protein [Chitinophagaceae bacterium LB-8]|uniref:DUF4288 domain-containing protein n=1 Tax=Paraflavisolibacter caeni TaxID=2982496 RepID=A0A9X2XPS5_9BACT|nr:DUF4288 domain-containing protein [Paraflavisolibacter caeni]MCU7552073.1 DUF4288 domain-containing protein [Paraflavisolibacter caeni]
MNWFLAKITYQIICGDGDHTPQFDEQLRLIGASNEKEAFAKAKKIGLSEEDNFYNQKQQLVQWVFINVSELNQLDLVDGAELYSRITEQDHAGRYIDLIHLKAEEIQSRYYSANNYQQAIA